MRRLFVALLALFSSDSFAAARLEGLEQRLDAFVEKHRPHPDTGIAIGVVENGKLIFTKTYGLRDRDKKLPVTPDTLFAVGTCTKSFVSLGAAILHDAQKLNLDQPIRAVLSDFALSDLRVGAEATFVDLLSHRVGLPRHDLLWYLGPFDADELYARLPFLGLNRKVGKDFREGHQYNNLMYMVLGRAIAQLSGSTWQEFTKRRILDPIGLTAANFSVEESQRASDFAMPYAGVKRLPFKSLAQVAPAGAINASLKELAQWVGFFERGGITETGDRLVSEAAFARMFRPESEEKIPEVGVEFRYGLGWFLNEVSGRKVHWHAGNIDGFSAHVSFLSEEKLGLVILTNEAAGSVFQLPWKLVRDGAEQTLLPYLIYEHLLGEKERDLGLLEDHELVNRLELATVSAVPDAPVSPRSPIAIENSGTSSDRAFTDLGYGELFLREQAGRLALDYYGTLLPLEPTPFPDLFLTPSLEQPGKTWEVRLERSRDEIVSVAVPFENELDPIIFVKDE